MLLYTGTLINNAGCVRQEGRLVKSAHTVWVIDCFVSERVFNLWEVRPSRTPSVLHGVEPLPAVCLPLLPCLGADLSSMRCFGCLDYRRDGKTKAKCHPKQKAWAWISHWSACRAGGQLPGVLKPKVGGGRDFAETQPQWNPPQNTATAELEPEPERGLNGSQHEDWTTARTVTWDRAGIAPWDVAKMAGGDSRGLEGARGSLTFPSWQHSSSLEILKCPFATLPGT